MKNIISSIVLITLIFVFGSDLYGQKVNEMKVKIVSQNLIVANKGKKQGVQKNSIYNICREGQTIGQAKVLLLEEEVSGLKVIKIESGYSVKNGDLLIIEKKRRKSGHNDGILFRPLRPKYCNKPFEKFNDFKSSIIIS
jgi:hypothetical protein